MSAGKIVLSVVVLFVAIWLTDFLIHAVQPLPAMLCVKWIVFGAIQGVILGLVLFAVCRPAREAAQVAS